MWFHHLKFCARHIKFLRPFYYEAFLLALPRKRATAGPLT